MQGLAELVVVHDWHTALRGIGVRTGYLTTAGSDQDALTAPTHTRGDLVLLRGRWLSIAALTKALRGIDGITHWQLRISRSGTFGPGRAHRVVQPGKPGEQRHVATTHRGRHRCAHPRIHRSDDQP